MRLVATLVLLASNSVIAAERRVSTSVDCHTEEAICAAPLEAMQAGAKAEKWTITDDAPLHLKVVVTPHAAFFELGDEKGLRQISHADLTDYRAPHAVSLPKMVVKDNSDLAGRG